MAKTQKHDPEAVQGYLAALPADQRRALEKVRRLVRKGAPDVAERISYGGVIVFSVGKDLVGCGANPKRLSFFTMSPAYAKEIAPSVQKTHNVSGATIHFSPDNPLPDALVARIVKRRLQEHRQAQKPRK